MHESSLFSAFFWQKSGVFAQHCRFHAVLTQIRVRRFELFNWSSDSFTFFLSSIFPRIAVITLFSRASTRFLGRRVLRPEYGACERAAPAPALLGARGGTSRAPDGVSCTRDASSRGDFGATERLHDADPDAHTHATTMPARLICHRARRLPEHPAHARYHDAHAR